MSGLRRYRISSRQAAREAWPQDVSATVQGMRWQGTDTKGGQLRRPYLRCENSRQQFVRIQKSKKSLRPCLARSRSAASVPRGALHRPHSTTVVSGARSG
jgi:hypothetical protein